MPTKTTNGSSAHSRRNRRGKTMTTSDNGFSNSDSVEPTQQREATSQFANALETMDRFLENDSNLVVQSLVSLETKTKISRQYLARGFLLIFACYFIFSNFILDVLTHLLTYLYPSYRSYVLLKNPDISKDELINVLKYWIFVSVYTTADFFFGFLIPFGSIIKFIFIVQCVLPHKSPLVDIAVRHVIQPLFANFERNENMRQISHYLLGLTYLNSNQGDQFDYPDQD